MYPQTYVGDELNNTLKSLYAQVSPNPMDSYTNDTGIKWITKFTKPILFQIVQHIAIDKLSDCKHC